MQKVIDDHGDEDGDDHDGHSRCEHDDHDQNEDADSFELVGLAVGTVSNFQCIN